jgi:hypothetical protein
MTLAKTLGERLKAFDRQNPDLCRDEWEFGIQKIVDQFMEENGYHERE